MPNQTGEPRITAVDFNPDTLFVTFADGITATYNASFIFSAREHDSNQVITIDSDMERAQEIGEPLA